MRVKLAFGKHGLDLDLPPGPRYQILHAHNAAPLADSAAAIAHALDAPIAGPPLTELARGKHTAAISVCDITRPVPNALILPHILQRLHQAGIAEDNITICIATGLHRAATPDELDRILGKDLAARLRIANRIANHDARDLSQHHHLGATRSGTPVHICDSFIDADLHITLGFIEPHLMAGFSGGRKLIAPGLAAEQTIKVLHSPKFMRDARSCEGSIRDNPLHAELLEISRMARHDFLVDVALAEGPSGGRAIAQVFAGQPEAAHATGIEFVSQSLLSRVDEPADAVITTSAGYPLDLTFYQAVKGVTSAAHTIKPGGAILLVAECSEGPGAAEFTRMLVESTGPQSFLDTIANAPVEVDQWQLEKLALVARDKRLAFYVPGLSPEIRRRLWGPSFDSPEAAVAQLVATLPPNPRIAVIPEGPYVLTRDEQPAPELAMQD